MTNNNLTKIIATCAIVVGTTLTFSKDAHAAGINIIDNTYGVGAGSFELGNFIDGGGIPYASGTNYMGLAPGNSTTLTGWKVGLDGDGVDWLIEPGFNADTGVHSLDLQHLQATSIFTQIPTIIGNIYQLSFAAATRSGFTTTGVVSAGSLLNQIFTATPTLNWSSQTYTPYSFNFTATSTTTIIRFTPTTNSGYGPAIDSVSVVSDSPTSIPESSSVLGLLALGTLGVGSLIKSKVMGKKPKNDSQEVEN